MRFMRVFAKSASKTLLLEPCTRIVRFPIAAAIYATSQDSASPEPMG